MTKQPLVNGSNRKWFILMSNGLGVFLATIDGSIVNIALPTLTRELNTQFSTVQWVVLAYMLTIVTLLLSIGRLADMIGKKKLFITGFVLFTVGSVLCGLASRVEVLILFRVFQGFGAAMTMALGPAIVTEAFPSSERGKALGINAMMVSLGSISGPTIGGIILSSLSWHWIFFVNLPVGIVGVLLAVRFIPETAPRGGQKFDFAGAGTLFSGLLCFLLALTFGQNIGFLTTPVILLFSGAVLFITSFILIEQRVSQPIIELSLFRNKLLAINILTGFLVFISASANVLLMPFYLQNVLRFPPNQAGLLLATVPVAMIVTAPLMGALSDKIGSRPLAMVGLLILALSFWGVSTLDQNTTALSYFLHLLPVGIGLGTFNSPNSSAIMGSAPRERMGVVSSMLALTRTMGQTTGHAINGAIWASLVRYYAGGTALVDVTKAPAAAQVAGLNGTIQVMVGLLIFGLVLGIWAFFKERQERRLGIAPSQQG